MLYKGRKEVVKLFDEYSSMVSEAKHKGKTEDKGPKILIFKQLFQKLLIALVQVKAMETNDSKISLNEIRQIVYCLYQSK